MRSLSAYAVLSSALGLTAQAAPRHVTLLSYRQLENDTSAASLPQNDSDPEGRAAAVSQRNAGFEYGASLIGEAAPFPKGALGDARASYDYSVWEVDRAVIDDDVDKDVKALTASIQANGGLNSLDDYINVLYGDAWQNSNPLQEAPGIMTNYTQDLLFSMERLSQNPYPLEQVKPEDSLPFEIPDDLAPQIAGVTLEELHSSGSLFVVDHRYQADLEKTTAEPPRYGAACSAYFFIHPESGDFLPLAIRTNAGSDLVYSPLDEADDWLLAKMMFNVNDFFHAQMFHLVVTHDVTEAVHLAALRTLGEKHPVMIILERLMLQGYSSRVVGEELCFNPGGHWDQLFLIDNVGCRKYVSDNWPTKGAYQSSYLRTDFLARGLVDSNDAFPFKTFPFYQDALAIHTAQHAFFASFVDAYYATDDDIAADSELAAWFAEVPATSLADFPSTPSREALADALAHFAFVISVVHHGLNGGDPMGSKATLPFHLNAMYAPVPEAKGVTDLLPFLPPADSAVHYIGFLATFNRPFYSKSERTLEFTFADAKALARLAPEVGDAALEFRSRMEDLSMEIRGRGFGEDGLSLGMPFVYRTLDPGYIPFFSAV